MSIAQAVLLGVALAVAAILLIVGAAVLLRRRRLEQRWKTAHQAWDGKLTVLPNQCTCCPLHGHPTRGAEL